MTKSITEEEYKQLSWKEKFNYVKEWKCKCNECGKHWNYLDKAEKEMRNQIGLNACLQVGYCCNPCMGIATSNANTQLSKQVKELKQCLQCKSSNVKCEARYFLKQK